MRDLGLESLGAQLSLLGRQVATSLNAILPEDLNPFGLYDEEEEVDPRCMAGPGGQLGLGVAYRILPQDCRPQLRFGVQGQRGLKSVCCHSALGHAPDSALLPCNGTR